MLRTITLPTGVMAILGLGLSTSATQCSRASRVSLEAVSSHPLLLADRPQTAYLKVGLKGLADATRSRAPLNLALVLDVSGSMEGERLQRAKEAACLAVEKLAPEDILSVLAYDSSVEVVFPAGPVKSKNEVVRKIRELNTRGGTALFAGVTKGAEEIRKNKARNRVNRIVLLSDGQANEGPSTPAELGQLGASLVKEGISVTTLGLGLDYNEDLMTQLAIRSDGNHGFVERPQELAKFFELEFKDLFAAVAQEVAVQVEFTNGVKPVRFLGRDADMSGSHAYALFNEIYSGNSKFLLFEVEVPARAADTRLDLAKVEVSYMDFASKATERLEQTISIGFTGQASEVESKLDSKIMGEAVAQIATANNVRAVALRDQGRVEEARKALLDNAAYLSSNARAFKVEALNKLSDQQKEDARNLEGAAWGRQRKMMFKQQQYQSQSATY